MHVGTEPALARYSTPKVEFSAANTNAIESGGQILIAVKLSSPATQIVTVKFKTKDGPAPDGATAPSDYIHTDDQLTFQIGNEVKTFPVQLVSDTKVELNEIVLLELYEPNGAELGPQSSATLTILDDDPANAVVEIEINDAGADDDFVFMTPSDAAETIYATATARNLTTGSGDLEVDLTNLAGAGDFFFSTAAGSEQSSSVKLTLPDDGTPVPFKLSGQTVSTKMGDAVIVAMLGAQEAGKKAGGVVKVEISFKYGASDTVKGVTGKDDDNAVQDVYKNERKDGTYNLGPGEFLAGGGSWNWGVLTIGKVIPKDHKRPVILERNAQGRSFIPLKDAKGQWLQLSWFTGATKDFDGGPTYRPSNDSGKLGSNIDHEPQSGISAGHVYDWDAPGIGPGTGDPVGSIFSVRANFYAFAVGELGGKTVVVSEAYKWYTRQSYKRTATGLIADGTVVGDNQTKDGEHTKLSYGLGSPSLTKTVPAVFDKSDNPLFGTLVFELYGKNLVDKPEGKTTMQCFLSIWKWEERIAAGLRNNSQHLTSDCRDGTKPNICKSTSPGMDMADEDETQVLDPCLGRRFIAPLGVSGWRHSQMNWSSRIQKFSSQCKGSLRRVENYLPAKMTKARDMCICTFLGRADRPYCRILFAWWPSQRSRARTEPAWVSHQGWSHERTQPFDWSPCVFRSLRLRKPNTRTRKGWWVKTSGANARRIRQALPASLRSETSHEAQRRGNASTYRPDSRRVAHSDQS